jgi:hypothetical protein
MRHAKLWEIDRLMQKRWGKIFPNTAQARKH